jgi:isoleucyl-tRNA synthetase
MPYEGVDYALLKKGGIGSTGGATINDYEFEIVDTFKGSQIVGKTYKPLFDFVNLEKESGKKAYYIADADFVTTEDGTGVVHTAVMYGEDDFQLGHKLDLPKVHTVDLQGKFNELVTPWVGMKVKDSDPAIEGTTTKTILEYLETNGKLYKTEKYEHDYPFCWRCKHPLLYYAKTSWFIRMSKLRKQLLENNAKVNWYPKHIQDGRFGEWLREVKDWAISRERYWGTPIPIWTCDSCDHVECIGGYGELAGKVKSKNTYLFVRHGQSDNNIAHTLDTELENGSANLTEMGHEQAKAAGEILKDKNVDLIFSSQFPRAKQTAAEISTILGKDVTEDKRLNEFHIGHEFEDKTYEEYHLIWGERADRFHKAPEGGETWMQIRERLVSFMNECEAQHEGKTIVVVTHADPILVMQWAVSFAPESAVETLDYPKNGGIVEINYPAAMFAKNADSPRDAEGVLRGWDPHRPFIDDVTYPCEKCSGTMKRIPEVADTWFDSGAMPFAQWHYPFENKERIDASTSYPANFISEAIDQTRGWFYTLLAIGTILEEAGVVEEGPYQNVVVLGHINDAKGKKLSKSLGNYIDPMTIIEQYGADAVRWFLYSVNQPWDPKNFDTKIVEEGVKKTFLILTNVLSFWKMYAGEASAVASNNILDRWITAKTNHLVTTVSAKLDAYDITSAAREIASYVTDLSTWYVRRSRDRFKGEEQAIAAATLQQSLLTLSKVMAPFTPFLADYLYKEVGGSEDSVHLENWPEVKEVDQQLLDDMEHVRSLVEVGHALRAKAGIKVRQPLQQFAVTSEVRPELDDILKDELNVKEIHTGKALPTGDEWVSDERAALDTSISDELKAEGMLRDLIREFNALRKIAKLQPSDTIIALLEQDSSAARVAEHFSQEFLTGVRASGMTPSLEGALHTTEIELDGVKMGIGLKVQ